MHRFYVILGCLGLLVFVAAGASGAARPNSLRKVLDDPKVSQKLDGSLKMRIEEILHGKGAADDKLDLIVRTHKDFTKSELKSLEKQGITFQSRIGDILTTRVAAKDLYTLAKQRKVKFIELSKEIKLNPPVP
jgi:hypothetical protein